MQFPTAASHCGELWRSIGDNSIDLLNEPTLFAMRTAYADGAAPPPPCVSTSTGHVPELYRQLIVISISTDQ